MKVREFGEDALIAAFAKIYGVRAGVEIGIGDDGAVVALGGSRQVISTDIATEGTHFNRSWSEARDIGAKIAIANLADIFAMGGRPEFLIVAIAASGDEEVSFLLDVAEGIESVAREHEVTVVGGDFVGGNSLTIAITALGSVLTPVLRSRAKSGDSLFITRASGRSLAGLLLLSRGMASKTSEEVKFFQHPDFHPGDLAKFGYENMSALMDVSDGLLSDLPKIARASSVGIDIQIDESKLSYLQGLSERLDISPVELFLRSGEEHSFIVGVPDEHLPKVPHEWIKIGKVLSGSNVTFNGKQLPFPEKSWHW